MKELLPALDNLTAEGLWYIQIFVIVFVTLIASFVARQLLNKLYERFNQSDKVWDDSVIDAMRKPVQMMIWIVGIAFAVHIIGLKTEAPIFIAVDTLREVAMITVLAWFLWRLVNNVRVNYEEKSALKGQKVDVTTADAVSKLLRASIIITSFLVALQTLGFSVSGVLAFGGIGGIAIGFAAKDLLANFFGGLMIYMDRPFEVGDWVRSPDRDIEGTVEHIGWRLTCIRTFDKRPLYIPNATFTSIAVQNPSRMTNRRIYETIGLRYDDLDKLKPILEDVHEMLSSHPEIDTSKTLMVNFNEFAASSLDFFIYTFTKTVKWDEYHQIKQDILFKIADIIARHGAEVAFPTSTVHIPEPMQFTQQVDHESSK
ncbi:MAG: mechanosensitive ion channel family protein [Gammaproteobacteria bacterium]|nr:mechanosensitive ion channel family protein [Gammaproteobacteria bacterium]